MSYESFCEWFDTQWWDLSDDEDTVARRRRIARDAYEAGVLRGLDDHEKLLESNDALASTVRPFSEPIGSCDWQMQYEGLWKGSCGITWSMDNDEGLVNNEMNFCPKCGKLIKELPAEGQQ